MSRQEKNINWALIMNFVSIFVLITPFTVMSNRFFERHLPPNAPDYLPYVFEKAEPVAEMTFKVFFSFFLLLTCLTPLDIIAVIELTKIIFAYIIQQDAWLMYFVPGNFDQPIEGLSV